MKMSVLIFLISSFSGAAFAATPDLSLHENVQEAYDSRVGIRKIVKTFVRSKQCQPKEGEFEEMMGLEYSFGCIFTYSKEWYALSATESGGHHLVHLDEVIWQKFVKENNELLRLRHKRRGYPQFRGSRPKVWFRYSTVAFREITVDDFAEVIRLQKEIDALEVEYHELGFTLLPE